MKAIIWIIVLALLGWGIWSWMDDDNLLDDNEANAVGALDYGNTDDTATDPDLGEFEDKG